MVEEIIKKEIILVPNQPPMFVGEWTLGEVMQMAQGLMRWIDNLKVVQSQPQEEEHGNST